MKKLTFLVLAGTIMLTACQRNQLPKDSPYNYPENEFDTEEPIDNYYEYEDPKVEQSWNYDENVIPHNETIANTTDQDITEDVFINRDIFLQGETISVKNGSSSLMAKVQTIAILPEEDEKGIGINTKAIENHLWEMINKERENQGLGTITKDNIIYSAAKIRSKELLVHFSHLRPNKSRYFTVFDEVGFPYSQKWHGENASQVTFSIGSLDEKEIAEMMFEDLKNSPTHLKNMLKSKYTVGAVSAHITFIDDVAAKVTSVQMFASE